MSSGDSRPIGVFDSGIGGLTVLKEIWNQLPNENTIYFGDSGRMPYGTKSHDTIVNYALQITRFLESLQVKMIVIACNSACAHSFEAVSQSASVPVVEVITSGAGMAAVQTRNGQIGVIATRATVESNVYRKAIEKQSAALLQKKENIEALSKLNITQTACPLFVMLAEEGWWDNDVARLTAEEYLHPMREKEIDTLLLGCTHYPLLADTIQQVMGKDIILINAGESVAGRVKNFLREKNMQAPISDYPKRDFYTSDDPTMFESQSAIFLGSGHPQGTKKIQIENY